MRKGNLIICLSCATILIAEWSSPGRLSFGFPFLTSPARDLAQVPAAWRESQNTLATKLESQAPPTAEPTCNSSPSFDRIQLASFEAAFMQGKIINLKQAQEYLGQPCGNEFLGVNGDRLTITETESGMDYEYYSSQPST